MDVLRAQLLPVFLAPIGRRSKPFLPLVRNLASAGRLGNRKVRQKHARYGGQSFQNEQPSPTAKAEPMHVIQNET